MHWPCVQLAVCNVPDWTVLSHYMQLCCYCNNCNLLLNSWGDFELWAGKDISITCFKASQHFCGRTVEIHEKPVRTACWGKIQSWYLFDTNEDCQPLNIIMYMKLPPNLHLLLGYFHFSFLLLGIIWYLEHTKKKCWHLWAGCIDVVSCYYVC